MYKAAGPMLKFRTHLCGPKLVHLLLESERDPQTGASDFQKRAPCPKATAKQESLFHYPNILYIQYPNMTPIYLLSRRVAVILPITSI